MNRKAVSISPFTEALSFLPLQLDVFDAAERYQREGFPLIILAGKKYGSGSSRDWAAKGPYLLVQLVSAQVARILPSNVA